MNVSGRARSMLCGENSALYSASGMPDLNSGSAPCRGSLIVFQWMCLSPGTVHHANCNAILTTTPPSPLSILETRDYGALHIARVGGRRSPPCNAQSPYFFLFRQSVAGSIPRMPAASSRSFAIRRTRMMCCRSISSSERGRWLPASIWNSSGRWCISMGPPWARITARSTTFSSSRIFPFHG